MNTNKKPANKGKIRFTEFTLDNGLNIILSRDTTIPSVVINVCYHVGSKDEKLTKTGYAHLFEHLMYTGSKNVPQGAYDRLTTYAGGENNAYTTEDKTNYYLILPSNQLELGLWLESDRMAAFAISQKALETQKNVVIEEKRQNFDNRPYGSVSIEFAPRLFKKSNYRWDTIGNIEDIEKATLDDIQEFFDTYYVPNNAVLTIVGDIDIDLTTQLVKKYFGDIKPSATIQRTVFDEISLSNETKDIIYDNVHLPGIFFGYRIPQENSREHFVFGILSLILGSGESSRLYRELVYRKQLVSEIGCFIDSKEFAGVFYIYGILMPGVKTEDVKKEMDMIIDKIKRDGAKAEEVQKAKNKIESHFTYRKQTNLYRADMLAHFKTFYNDADLVNTNIKKYLVITPEDVYGSANEFIHNSNRVVLTYMPRDTAN